MLVGQQIETTVTPQPPIVETVAYQPHKMYLGGSVRHYDEDHGDHVVHRERRRDVYYTPETQYTTRVHHQPDLVETKPVTNFYSIPVQHHVDTSHVEYQPVHHVENSISYNPREVEHTEYHVGYQPHTVEHQGVEYVDEEYTEMVPVKKTRKVAKPVTHKETVMKEVVTPVTHKDTVMEKVVSPIVHTDYQPVVHHQTSVVTGNHIVTQPVNTM